MQVQETTHFYKFSIDKNRVENCDLFSRPVFTYILKIQVKSWPRWSFDGLVHISSLNLWHWKRRTGLIWIIRIFLHFALIEYFGAGLTFSIWVPKPKSLQTCNCYWYSKIVIISANLVNASKVGAWSTSTAFPVISTF